MHIDYSLGLPTGPDYSQVLSYDEMVKIVGDLIEKLKKPDPGRYEHYRRFRGFEWSIHASGLYIQNSLYPGEDAEISIGRRIFAMDAAPGKRLREPEEISYSRTQGKWCRKRALETGPQYTDPSPDDYSFIINFILEAFYYMDLRKKKAKEINEKVYSILNTDYGLL